MINPMLSVLLFVGFLALLGFGLIWMVRHNGYRLATSTVRIDPLEIARRRLAGGEITTTEFEEIRSRLRS